MFRKLKEKNWKEHLKNRLKIIAFIFALVGWFLLTTVILEEIFKQDLSSLEIFIENSIFKWGIKIFVIILLIFLIKGQKLINNILEKYIIIKTILKIIFIGGLMGWIIGLISLI